MEQWQKTIILNNKEKLIEATYCSYPFLTRLLHGRIISDDDFDRLVNMRSNQKAQLEALYEMVMGREHGFEILLKALGETNQKEAEQILNFEYSRVTPYVRFRKLFEKVKESDDLKIVKEELEVFGKGYELTRLWEMEEKPLLHCVTFYATPEIFHELVVHEISRGRNDSLKSRDKWGSSVLHNAVLFFEPLDATLQLFKSNGVDMNARDAVGDTVLFNAVKAGAGRKFLNTLLKFGANPRLVNNKQDSLLHQAAKHGNRDAIYLFVSTGCDVKARNADGDTPLHSAINGKNQQEIVLSLLKHGADVHAINHYNSKPTDHQHIQAIYDAFHPTGW